MPQRPEEIVAALRKAAQDFTVVPGDRKVGDGVNPAQVRSLVGELVDGIRGIPEATVYAAAKILRRRRLFPELTRLVEAHLGAGNRPRLLRTLYAQALIDQGQLVPALGVLEPLLGEPPDDDKAAEEARGLVGRVHKQAFVEAGTPPPRHGAESLRLAISAYAEAYRRARLDRLWPGINLVACACRARAERIDLPETVDVPALARQLLEGAERALEKARQRAMEAGDDPVDEPWAVATALEAALALDDEDAAVGWARRYLACEQADAFELGSTHRQLTEIWRLHEREGSKVAALVPLLEAELLRRKPGAILQGAVGMRAVDLREPELQAVWGRERFQTWRWMRDAVRCSDSVGQVQDPSGRAVGTGFLVMARDLRAGWGDELVLLTNRHVVDDPRAADPPGLPRGIHPLRAQVCFTALRDQPAVRVKALLWRPEGPHVALDTVVLRLQALPAQAAPLDLSGETADLRAGGADPSRIYVIGHPGGRGLSYSMYGNELRSLQPPFLFYRSPTEEGSSGSPVFNPDFHLIGIHHSAVPADQVNRGSLIAAVREAIAR